MTGGHGHAAAITDADMTAGRAPGAAMVSAATVLLGLLAAGLFAVSLAAQYRYVFAVKHQPVPSMIEAAGLDAGMVVFSLLALGLAVAGQSARIERALIVVCAVASAGQNYAAADVTSPRSVAAYVLPPLFLALVVDRVVAVARRHVLGDSERSVWAALGRTAGLAALYGLRFVLAAPSTAKGIRRLILAAAPLPGGEGTTQKGDDHGKQGRQTVRQGQGRKAGQDPGTRQQPEEQVTSRTTVRSGKASGRAAEAVRMLDANPDLTQEDIGARLGISGRQVRRDLAAVNGHGGGS